MPIVKALGQDRIIERLIKANMLELIVTGFLLGLLIYVLMGLAFSIPFVFKGAHKIDPSAIGATLGFKLIIIPGVIIFWPVLLLRWMNGTPPPKESSPHRDSSCSQCGACELGDKS